MGKLDLLNGLEFSHYFLDLYNDKYPEIVSRMRSILPKLSFGLKENYRNYLSFAYSLNDYIPKSHRFNQKTLLVGGERIDEVMAINRVLHYREMYAINSNWNRNGYIPDRLVKEKLPGSVGGDCLRNGEKFDLILLHNLNHETNPSPGKYVDQSPMLYSHILDLMDQNSICFASYYHEDELNEALLQVSDRDILYAGENKRKNFLYFNYYFNIDKMVCPPSDDYILVFKK